MRNPPIGCGVPGPRQAGTLGLRLVFTLRIRHPAENAANTPLGGGVSPRTGGGLLSDGVFGGFWVFPGPWSGWPSSGVALMRVIVAGAGIGGLSAALSLHAAGIDATVIDSAASLQPLGVGINLMPHAVRELTELGLGAELEATGLPTAEMVHFDRHGNRIWGFACGRNIGYRWPQYSIHRGELQMILLAAVQARLGPDAVRTGTAFSSFAESASGVEVRVRDRSTGAGEPPPRWGGIMMWRGVMEGAPFLTGRTVAVAGANAALKFVAYPISRQAERRGRALVNWVAEVMLPRRAAMDSADWNRPGRATDVLPWFADWKFGWLDVPALIAGTPRILEYPMVDRDPLPSWGHGRVTLLGDAAHPMYPIGANGGSQAVVDARVLAWSLARGGSPAEGLAAYQAQRLPVVNAIVLACRDMPADRLLQTVSTRAPGGFERIEDVLSAAELASFDQAYRATTLPDVAALNSRPSLTPLPAVGRGVRVAADGLGILGRLVHRLHRDPAGAPQPDPDAAIAPRAAPEREAHVPRVLQVQRHPHRDVPVQQRARLDQQGLALPEVTDEDVAGRVQQQQAGGLLRTEHVAIPSHRIVHLGVVGVLPGLVPDVRGVPVVLDVAGGGQEAVLADPDLLAVLHRQRHDLARVVVGQRHVPGAAGLHHDQWQPRHLPVPRALQRHVDQPGLRLGPEQHVVGEVDPVLGREGELRRRDGGAGDLAV